MPRGDGPTRTSAPRNVCDFCGRGVTVCVDTKGKGHWGYWADRWGRIRKYAHASCIDAANGPSDESGGAV